MLLPVYVTAIDTQKLLFTVVDTYFSHFVKHMSIVTFNNLSFYFLMTFGNILF